MKRHSPVPGPFSVFLFISINIVCVYEGRWCPMLTLWLVARVMNSAATPMNWGSARRSACTVASAVVFNVIAHFQRFLLGVKSSTIDQTIERSSPFV